MIDEKYKERKKKILLMDHIFELIKRERERQEIKWGSKPTPDEFVMYAVLGEEFGEVGRAILNKDIENYKEELIQVAAVAVRILEALEERGMKLSSI